MDKTTVIVFAVLLTASVAQATPITNESEWADYLSTNADILGAGLTIGFVTRFFVQFSAQQLRMVRMLSRRGC